MSMSNSVPALVARDFDSLAATLAAVTLLLRNRDWKSAAQEAAKAERLLAELEAAWPERPESSQESSVVDGSPLKASVPNAGDSGCVPLVGVPSDPAFEHAPSSCPGYEFCGCGALAHSDNHCKHCMFPPAAHAAARPAPQESPE